MQVSALRKKLLYERSRKGQHLSVVAIDNINFQRIMIASYLTEPVDYWKKATKISKATIHYWEVSVKYLDQIAIAPPPGEILWVAANLRVYLKVIRNRLLQVRDISWKFRFCKYIRIDSDRCSKKKDVVFGFENTYEWSFFS